MTVKSRSPSRASPSRRSRVTPGLSSTSARRRPTSRLNSVDLPTLGRPTMATVKLMRPYLAGARAKRTVFGDGGRRPVRGTVGTAALLLAKVPGAGADGHGAGTDCCWSGHGDGACCCGLGGGRLLRCAGCTAGFGAMRRGRLRTGGDALLRLGLRFCLRLLGGRRLRGGRLRVRRACGLRRQRLHRHGRPRLLRRDCPSCIPAECPAPRPARLPETAPCARPAAASSVVQPEHVELIQVELAVGAAGQHRRNTDQQRDQRHNAVKCGA